jgi:hypothetical protein
MKPFNFLRKKEEPYVPSDPERHHIRPGVKPLWMGPVHFRMPSAEASLVLPERRPMESAEIAHFIITGELPADYPQPEQ